MTDKISLFQRQDDYHDSVEQVANSLRDLAERIDPGGMLEYDLLLAAEHAAEVVADVTETLSSLPLYDLVTKAGAIQAVAHKQMLITILTEEIR